MKAITAYVLVLLFWPIPSPATDELPVNVVRSATDDVLTELNATREFATTRINSISLFRGI